jgi:hypothetical protein
MNEEKAIPPSPERDEELLKAAKNLKFELLRQAFYHADEFWFFLFVERLTKFLSVMAATAVVASVVARHPSYATMSAIIITALQMLGLVFGFHTKAVLHDRLRERYFALLTELETQPLSAEAIAKINSQMIREWEKEPVTFWCIDALAWNSALSTMSKDIKKADFIKIYALEKFIRHVYRFSPEYFRKREYHST